MDFLALYGLRPGKYTLTVTESAIQVATEDGLNSSTFDRLLPGPLAMAPPGQRHHTSAWPDEMPAALAQYGEADTPLPPRPRVDAGGQSRLPAGDVPDLPPSEQEVMRRKNYLHSVAPLFDNERDQDVRRVLYEVFAESELELARAASARGEVAMVHMLLVSAATGYAKAGDPERAAAVLERCPARTGRDRELMRFFRARGVVIPAHLENA